MRLREGMCRAARCDVRGASCRIAAGRALRGPRGLGRAEKPAAPASEGNGAACVREATRPASMGERPRCSEVRFGVVRASSIFDFDSSCFQVAARWQRGSVDQPASSSGCLVDISRRSAAKRRATSLVLSERETIYRLPLRSLGSTSNRSLVS